MKIKILIVLVITFIAVLLIKIYYKSVDNNVLSEEQTSANDSVVMDEITENKTEIDIMQENITIESATIENESETTISSAVNNIEIEETVDLFWEEPIASIESNDISGTDEQDVGMEDKNDLQETTESKKNNNTLDKVYDVEGF